MDEDRISAALIELILKRHPEFSEDEITSKYNSFFESNMDDLSSKLLEQLERTAHRGMRKVIRFRNGFERRLKKRWRLPLEMLHTHIQRCLTEGKTFNETFRDQAVENQDFVFEALVRLHGKATQLSLEVLTLLESGCADGAFARWRTLYETSIFALLIEKYGQETAERYLNYLYVEEYNSQIELKEIGGAGQGLSPQLEQIVSKLSQKYGDDFRNRKYGWLAHLFPSKERNMHTFQTQVDMGYANELYRSACTNVHSGPDSLFKSLGLIEDSQTRQLIVAGPSNYGLSLPGQMTAASLTQVTVLLLLSKVSMDRIIVCNAIDKYTDKTQQAFKNCQEALASDHIEQYGNTLNGLN